MFIVACLKVEKRRVDRGMAAGEFVVGSQLPCSAGFLFL